jgi:DNA-binding CsgD family transcriptional regulator
MRHFLLLAYTIVLIAGTYAATYTWNVGRRCRITALNPLLGFLLCFNASVLVNQVFHYLLVNLAGSRIEDLPAAVLVATYAADLLLEGGMAWFLFLAVAALREHQPSEHGHWLAGGVAAAFGVGLVLGATHYLETASRTWLDAVYWVLWGGGILVNGVALARLAVEAHPRHGADPNGAARMFAWLFLARYGCVLLGLVLPDPAEVAWTAGILLLTNVIPLFWLRWHFVPSRIGPASSSRHRTLDAVTRRYRISKREREIVELLLQGKTYKEIQDVLFISFNTVKNHAYNVYQKLGVRSRGQLAHLVLQEQDASGPIDGRLDRVERTDRPEAARRGSFSG